MTKGLAGVSETDATVSQLIKKVRNQALELLEVNDALRESKEHGDMCEKRIAELLATSLGGARGSATRESLLERQVERSINSTRPGGSTPSRGAGGASSMRDEEARVYKQKLFDLQAVCDASQARAEEYMRRSELQRSTLRCKIEALTEVQDKLHDTQQQLLLAREERDYLVTSAQPNNLRPLNKSAASVAVANAHLLQGEVWRLKERYAAQGAEITLAAQRERGLEDSVQKLQEKLVGSQKRTEVAELRCERAESQQRWKEQLSRDEVSLPDPTPRRAPAAYAATTATASSDAMFAHVSQHGLAPPTPAPSTPALTKYLTAEVARLGKDNDRLLQLCDSIRRENKDNGDNKAKAMPHSKDNTRHEQEHVQEMDNLRQENHRLRGENEEQRLSTLNTSSSGAAYQRLEADNARLLQLCESVRGDVLAVDEVIGSSSSAWSELAQRLQRSELLGKRMNVYIRSLTGSDFQPTGNTVNADQDSGDDEGWQSEATAGDASTLRSSCNRLTRLLKQSEEERNLLLSYLRDAEGTKEALSSFKAEMEGRYSTLLQLQQSTAQDNSDAQRELVELGKANNAASAQVVESGRTVNQLTTRLREKETEVAELARENDELTQQQVQSLLALRSSRALSSKHDGDLGRLNDAITNTVFSPPGSAVKGKARPEVEGEGAGGSSTPISPSSSSPSSSSKSAAAAFLKLGPRPELNIQLLEAKLAGHDRKYESVVGELRQVRSAYEELKPRYNKLETKFESDENKIRSLVDEVLQLRPYRDMHFRLSRDMQRAVAGEHVQAPAPSADEQTPPPPPPASAMPGSSQQQQALSRVHQRKAALLGQGQQQPAPAPAQTPLAAASAQVKMSIPRDGSEPEWIHCASVQAMSGQLYENIQQLYRSNLAVTQAAAASAEEASRAQAMLDQEAELNLHLKAQVTALQTQVASYGETSTATVREMHTQMMASQSDHCSRVRELEMELSRLQRCEETLRNIKFVIASGGYGGPGGLTAGMLLLKTHLPKLVDLTVAEQPVQQPQYSQKEFYVPPLGSDSDTDDSLDDGEGRSRQAHSGDGPFSQGDQRRYLHTGLHSHSNDLRSDLPTGAAPYPMCAQPHQEQDPETTSTGVSVQGSLHAMNPYVATEKQPAPGTNDLHVLLDNFSDAMLSEVVGRAMLAYQPTPAPTPNREHEMEFSFLKREKELKHRLKLKSLRCVRELAAEKEANRQLQGEHERLVDSHTKLEELHAKLRVAKNEASRELSEVLQISEKQVIVSNAHEGKIQGYKQKDALRTSQINTLQQRESAIKSRLVVAIRDFGSPSGLVQSVMNLLEQGLAGSPSTALPLPSEFPTVPAVPAVYKHSHSHSNQSQNLDRMTDLVQATADSMARMWQCLLAVNESQVQRIAMQHKEQHSLLKQQLEQQQRQNQQYQHQYQQQYQHRQQYQQQQQQQQSSREQKVDAVDAGTSIPSAPAHGAVSADPLPSVPAPVSKNVTYDLPLPYDQPAAPVPNSAEPSLSLHVAIGCDSFRDSQRKAEEGHRLLEKVSASAALAALRGPEGGVGVDAKAASGISSSAGCTGSATSMVSGNLSRSMQSSSHAHSDSTAGLMSPATHLQSRLKDAKSRFASLRENWT